VAFQSTISIPNRRDWVIAPYTLHLTSQFMQAGSLRYHYATCTIFMCAVFRESQFKKRRVK